VSGRLRGLRGNDVLVFEHLVVTGDPRAAASAKHKTLGTFARTAGEKSQRCANRMMIRNSKAIKELRQGEASVYEGEHTRWLKVRQRDWTVDEDRSNTSASPTPSTRVGPRRSNPELDSRDASAVLEPRSTPPPAAIDAISRRTI
jgi:hypothetical protein